MTATVEELTFPKLQVFMGRLATERRTGTLRILGEDKVSGNIEVYQGKISRVESPFSQESLAEVAQKLRFISREDVHKASELQTRVAGVAFGDALVQEGIISRGHLAMCQRYQLEAQIYSLLGFRGRISFSPGTIEPSESLVAPGDVLVGVEQRLKTEEFGEGFIQASAQAADVGVVASAPPPEKADLADVVLEMASSSLGATEILLSYGAHYAQRVALFASGKSGLRLMRAHAPPGAEFPEAFQKLELPSDGTLHIYGVLKARTPFSGPIQMRGDADEALVDALGGPPSGDILLFPIAFGDSIIGILYGDGIVGTENLRELEAAVSVTALAMGNKLLSRKIS